MTKTLAELRTLCDTYGLAVAPQPPAKEPYIHALRDHFWQKENPGQPLPEQIEPMLLRNWDDINCEEADAIKRDDSWWCIQEKKDGIRALLHVTEEGIRITGRTISEVNFRLSEFASNVTHLTTGFETLAGTILDGELVCPKSIINTGDTITTHPLQAAVAILATTPANAKAIQDQQDCRLKFVAFDVLRFRGTDTTIESLRERLTTRQWPVLLIGNPHI